MKKLLLITALCCAFNANAQFRLVKDIFPGSQFDSSSPKNFYEYNGRLFFSAFTAGATANERTIFVTDGTEAGTVPITLASNGSGIFAKNYAGNVLFAEFNSELYFDIRSASNKVYIVKLTGNNTYTEPNGIMEISATSLNTNSRFGFPALYDNKIVFNPVAASNGGVEPYVADLLNPANNGILLDINTSCPGLCNSNPMYCTSLSSGILFAAYSPTNGIELWKTDGTTAGTVLFQDINAGAGDSNPDNFNVLGSQLTFAATHATLGRELFKTNGNTGNLVLIKDINTAGDSNPSNVTEIGGILYFGADNGAVGQELWKSNGLNSGTSLIKDINPSGDSNPSDFVQIGTDIYFSADDGVNGRELWKTDGTNAGTVMIKNITAGSASTTFEFMTEYNGKLYFKSAGLWVSDGTDAGTFNMGVSSTASYFYVFNNELYLTYASGSVGTELFAYKDPSLSVNDFNSLETSISLFPNPTQNYFEIETTETLSKVEVYSLQGQVVKSFVPQNQYDISELSSGMYFVKIQANNNEITKRIVKE